MANSVAIEISQLNPPATEEEDFIDRARYTRDDTSHRSENGRSNTLCTFAILGYIIWYSHNTVCNELSINQSALSVIS